MYYVAGIDLGSTYSKAIVLTDDLQVVGTAVRRTGFKLGQAADAVFAELMENAHLERSQIEYVTSTGYGRYTVPFRHVQITELTCHAQAVHHLFPDVRTMLDIGGQDIKAVRVDERGAVRAFRLNDKCAAGTGRFLGAASYALELPLADLGPLALKATDPVQITTTCTVFAETEIISHLAKGRLPEDVLMGMHQAIATRCASLVRRVGLESEVTFTGGVSRNRAMVQLLEAVLETPINVSPDSHFVGALGAALVALDRATGAVPAVEELAA